MKNRLLCAASLLCALGAQAASFSYQGHLQDAGKPAEGRYDLELTLFSAADGGRVLAGPMLLYAVPVHEGAFTTQADFGTLTNMPDTAWLSVKLRTAGGGEYTALSARSPVSAALTAATSSVCPGAWALGGNAGNPAGSYLGTADAQPLTFKVNGAQAGQIAPGSGPNPQYVNVVLGPNSAPGAAGAVVGGGNANVAGYFGTVGGGTNNQAGSGPIGPGANTVGGGSNNTAIGSYSTVGGGEVNFASGAGATIPGGQNNQAGGQFSFAAGQGAIVRDAATVGGGNVNGDVGTFVWNDGVGSMTSTGPDQFIVHATGGVGINTAPPNSAVELTVQGNDNFANLFLRQHTNNNGVLLTADAGTAGNNDASFYLDTYNVADKIRRLWLRGDNGFVGLNRATQPGSPFVVGTDGTNGNGAHLTIGGAWTNGSSREFKHAFAPIDTRDILERLLALPIKTWSYKDAGSGRHLGPVAEEFKTAFGLGDEERYIATVDEEGVALAAIQGLNRKLEAENAELRVAMDKLAQRLQRLEHAREQ